MLYYKPKRFILIIGLVKVGIATTFPSISHQSQNWEVETEFVAFEQKSWINVIEIFNNDVRGGDSYVSNPGIWLKNGKFSFRVVNLQPSGDSIFQGDDQFLQACNNNYNGDVILNRFYRVRITRNGATTTIQINDSICQIVGLNTNTYFGLSVATGYEGSAGFSGNVWLRKFSFKNL